MGAFGNLIPLIVLFVVIGGGAYVGYQIYLWSNEMTDRGKKHMEKKNMSFTKDGGLKVGVKERSAESYGDSTQKVLVNVWNNADLSKPKSGSGSSTPRPSNSRTTSSASASGAAVLTPPASSRGGSKRSTSPMPGGF